MGRGVKLGFVMVAFVLLLGTFVWRIHSCLGERARTGLILLNPEQMNSQEKAPAFTVTDPWGRAMSSEMFRGQNVLINFWATWCDPCREELPHLAALAEHLSQQPILLWLISVDDHWDAVQNMIQSIERTVESSAIDENQRRSWSSVLRMLHGDMPNVRLSIDGSERSARLCGTQKYPETYWMDKSGVLRMKFVGPKAWGHPRALEFVDQALQANK
jgi:cytochrome c biogenesis protein CcmG, thiol:disulfide interchange protein DsbE